MEKKRKKPLLPLSVPFLNKNSPEIDAWRNYFWAFGDAGESSFLLSSIAEEWLTYTPLIEKSSQYQGFSLMDNAPN